MSNPNQPPYNIDADPTSRWWLYAWGTLPTNLDDLRAYLAERHISVERFKQSARYQANLETYPWLKEL